MNSLPAERSVKPNISGHARKTMAELDTKVGYQISYLTWAHVRNRRRLVAIEAFPIRNHVWTKVWNWIEAS